MEPPPRLYHYEGLFTSSRSLDLPLKILMICVVLLILVFVSAWHLSRKLYRRAPSFKKFIPRVRDLFHDDSQDAAINLGATSKLDVLTTKMGRSMVLVVNNWKLINLYEQSENMDCFYSAAPGSLRRKWYGLLVSDSTLTNRTALRSVLVHAFISLSFNAYLSFGYISSCTLRNLRRLDVVGTQSTRGLDSWVLPIVADFLFFSYHEFWKRQPENEFGLSSEIAHFINRFANHVAEIECYHIDGNLKNINRLLINRDIKPISTVSELLSNLEKLIHPLVRRVLAQTLNSDERTCNMPHSTDYSHSFLNQLIRSYRQMELQGEYVDSLKVDHLSHSLCEIGMILRAVLTRHLRLLLAVLAQRPLWQSRLRNEAAFAHEKLAPFENPLAMKGSPHPLKLLFQQTRCLVWTKALASEVMRCCAPAWPFGCLREAVRDGELDGFEYAEGELVLFNQPFYLSDSRLWEEGESFPGNAKHKHLPFNPMRFIECEPGTTSFHHLKWPAHWTQFILKSCTVYIPNETLYRMLITLLLHLSWTGWEIRTVDPNDALSLSDNPVCITSDWPDIHLQPPLQQ